MNNKLNVLVLEHSKSWHKSIRNYYGELIRKCGYNSNFIFIDKASGFITDTKKNHSVFDKNEIDLFISDIKLGNTDGPFAGLKVIKKVKEEYPELVVIANSGEPISTRDISQHNPSFDLFVDKAKFLNNNDKYDSFILLLFNKLLNRNVYLEVDIDNSSFPESFHIERTAQKNVVKNLLKFITFNSKERECSVTRVTLRKIEEGNSGSYVFQMDGFLHNGIKCINSIVKISGKDKSRIEKENYDRFVKWNLPYTWRVELLSYAEWQDYGCICYSYAFDKNSIIPVTEYIKEHRVDKLLQVLNTIFNPKNVTWYSPENITEHPSIAKYYHSKWYNFDRGRLINSFSKIISDRSVKVVESDLHYLSYKAPNPEGFLFRDIDGCQACICHGDLNSNNVLLADKVSTPVFIDFQDTGVGHVFVDFIVFENCLRLYYNQERTLAELIEFEIELNKIIIDNNTSEISSHDFKMFDIFIKLRKSAFETFPTEARWKYIYGLAMSSYARLRDPDKLYQWQINQIFASLFSSLLTLSNLDINVPDQEDQYSGFVFASYATQNVEFVHKVVSDLGREGAYVWFDKNQVKPGADIHHVLQDSIEQSKGYLVFIGEDYGQWQKEEVDFIIAEKLDNTNKVIIPCIIPGTLPDKIPGFLKKYSYIDFNTNYPQKLIDLSNSIKEIES